MRLFGSATGSATAALRDRATLGAEAHTRFGELSLSSVGVGLRCGDEAVTAAQVEGAVQAAVEAVTSGVNVLGATASPGRRVAERAIGEAIGRLAETKGVTREALFVMAGGGFLEGPGAPVGRRCGPWLDAVSRRYVARDLLCWGDLAQAAFCLRPSFLEDEVSQSLAGLGIEKVDLFWIHGFEEHLAALERGAALERLAGAMETLEHLCSEGRVGAYGIATDDGLRIPPDAPRSVQLAEILGVARAVGGSRHRCRAVQVPLSIRSLEAVTEQTQTVESSQLTALEAAHALGLYVVVTGVYGGGKLDFEFGSSFCDATRNLTTDHQRVLQICRSVPHVGTALFETSRRSHAREGALVMAHPRLDEHQLDLVFDEEPDVAD